MARPRPLQCPFCDNYLRAPIDLNFSNVEVTGGICTCGAVYVLDRTAHNVGEIFMDALTFVCRGDIDKALALDPGDYESEELGYDMSSNEITNKSRTGKLCKLVFVRLKNAPGGKNVKNSGL